MATNSYIYSNSEHIEMYHIRSKKIEKDPNRSKQIQTDLLPTSMLWIIVRDAVKLNHILHINPN